MREFPGHPPVDDTVTSEKIEADFKNCFAERAPNEPGFANAVKRAKDMLTLMPAK